MKKALFFAGLAAALSLVGCNKEADLAGNGRKVEIVLSNVDTRTINNGMSTEWNAGDELSVFNAAAGTTTWSSNIKFTVQDASANRATGEVDLTADAYDWYLFYPYTSQLPNPTTVNDSGAKKGYTTVGGQFQSQKEDDNMEHLAGSKVPVLGNVKNVPASETPVVVMKNAASVVRFKVVNAQEEAIRILSVKFTAPEDIVGTYYIDFSGTAPTFVASGATYVFDNVTVTNSDPTDVAPDSNSEFYAVIKPFTAAAGSKLKVEVEAENAAGTKKGTATKEITLTAASEFKSGFIKTLNVPFDVTMTNVTAEALPYEQSFAEGAGDFTIDNVIGSGIWTPGSNSGNNFMKGTSYLGGKNTEGESWLVSPEIDATTASNGVKLSFQHCINKFFGDVTQEATLWAREKGGDWKQFTISYPTPNGTWSSFVEQVVDLSEFKGKIFQFAFKYVGHSTSAGTWEVMDVHVTDAVVTAAFNAELPGADESLSLTVPATTSSVTINVTGNVAWTASASDGATAAPDSGEGAGTVTVSFPANTDPAPKEYSVTVSTDDAAIIAAGGDEFVFTITQEAASTEAKAFPYEESFATSQGDFTINDVNKPTDLTFVWAFDSRGFMKASAFKSNTNYDAESWLISPVVDLATAQNPELTFAHATNYFSSPAKAQEETSVWVREEGGAWAAVEGVNYPTSQGWTFVDSGSLDLSAYKGKKVQIGFKYTSTADKAGTWEIQNFKLAEASVGPVEPGVTTATIDFSQQGYTNGQEVSSVTENGVTATFDKGTNSNGPKYYDTGSAVRMYGSNTMTVSADGKTIISIEFTFGSGDGTNPITADVPTFETPTWTGEAGSVTFTIGGTSGARRIKAITVKYTDDVAPVTPKNPTFTVTETLSVGVGATEKINVTTNTDGTITYTSANTAVATVATDGTVTGVAAGSTTITVAAAATSAYNATSATVAVTVTAPVDGNVVSMTMSQYVEEHNCTVSAGTDATMYKTLQLNASVRMSTTGEDNCGSFWNTSSSNTTKQWRLYQNKGGNVIVSVAQGCELKSVKLTFSPSGNGILLDGEGNAVASGAVQDVSGSSVTYTVGNSEQGGTSGQIRITAVEVVYTGNGTTFPDEPSQPTETETKITMAGNATVYVGETVALNATSNVEVATITYESEDPSIATVSASGVVTGVAEGAVKVYARIAGVAGSYTDAERYCNVTVSNKPVETDGTEVFIFSELGYANQADVTTVNGSNVSLVFAKGEGSNAPKYYTSGTNVRMYKNNTLTVSSEKTITKIEFFCASGYDVHSETTFSTGTCSDNVWTGNAKSVEMVNATSGSTQIRFTSIKVTYE